MDLKIPPCPFRGTDGSAWPRHRAKARSKTYNRRRKTAAPPEEDTRGTSYSV